MPFESDLTFIHAPASVIRVDHSPAAWFGRFAFSFVIIAVYLTWMGMHAGDRATGYYYFAGAIVAFVLGGLGFRARHSRP